MSGVLSKPVRARRKRRGVSHPTSQQIAEWQQHYFLGTCTQTLRRQIIEHSSTGNDPITNAILSTSRIKGEMWIFVVDDDAASDAHAISETTTDENGSTYRRLGYYQNGYATFMCEASVLEDVFTDGGRSVNLKVSHFLREGMGNDVNPEAEVVGTGRSGAVSGSSESEEAAVVPETVGASGVPDLDVRSLALVESAGRVADSELEVSDPVPDKSILSDVDSAGVQAARASKPGLPLLQHATSPPSDGSTTSDVPREAKEPVETDLPRIKLIGVT
ncbi:hypothetical protein LTR08_005017 [Meristemomyces frigidus]|nr:hypothetical protein LTR08_005017 [Meristemomyces frigidus]